MTDADVADLKFLMDDIRRSLLEAGLCEACAIPNVVNAACVCFPIINHQKTRLL